MGLIIVPGEEPDPRHGEHVGTITPEEIDRWVREAIAANRATRRTSRSHEALDRAVEVLHAEGETYLAAGVLALMSARVSGLSGEALGALLQLLVEAGLMGGLDRRCRVCGCTQEFGCEGGCSWVEMDLCSRCDAKLKRQARAAYRGSAHPGPGRDG